MAVSTGEPLSDSDGETARLFKLIEVGYGSNLSSDAIKLKEFSF